MLKELGLVAIGAIALTMILIGTSDEAEAAAYIKYDGIDGEAEDKVHDNWIDILSVGWSAQQPGAQQSGGDASSRMRGSVVMEDMTLTMEFEKSSVKLLEKMLMGEIIPKLEIELTKNFGVDHATYLKYELTNVMITSFHFQASGDKNAGPPIVVIGNSFEEIKVTYTEFDDKGSSKGNVETTHKVERGE